MELIKYEFIQDKLVDSHKMNNVIEITFCRNWCLMRPKETHLKSFHLLFNQLAITMMQSIHKIII